MADLEFRRDLYRGTARDYDRFRVPYPRSLVDDLAERSGAACRGRLLDLACGTGQVALPWPAGLGESGRRPSRTSPAWCGKRPKRPGSATSGC